MRDFIENDAQFRGNQPFILIGHSQGTLVSRALLELWDNHPVQMFVSLAGPHLGQFGLFADLISNPFLRGLVTSTAWTVLYTQVKYSRAIQCDTHSDFPLLSHISCDISCSWPRKSFALQTSGAILITTISSWLRLHSFRRSTITWNIPTHRAFAPTSLEPQVSSLPSSRIIRLDSDDNLWSTPVVHLFGSPHDEVIMPWQSSLIGCASSIFEHSKCFAASRDQPLPSDFGTLATRCRCST